MRSPRDRRGVAEFIAMLIILLVVVSLSVSLYAYSTGVFSAAGSSYQHQVSESKERVEERFMVTSVYPEMIRNYSFATLLQPTVLINGTNQTSSSNLDITPPYTYYNVTSGVNFTKTFYDLGSGSEVKAYEYQVSSKPPSSYDVPNNNFTDSGYVNITDYDDLKVLSEADISYYAAHRFKFKIEDRELYLSQINVTWSGRGWHENVSGTVYKGVTVYIWNNNTGYELLNQNDNDDNVTLTGIRNENETDLNNYISDTDRSLTILVVQNDESHKFKKPKGGWENKLSKIETNWVGLEATWRTDYLVTYRIDYLVDVGSIDLASVIELNVTEKGWFNIPVDQAYIEIFNWERGGWEEVIANISQTGDDPPHNVSIISVNPQDYINETWGWMNLTLRAVDSGDPFNDFHDWIMIRITNETVPDPGDLYFHIFNFGKREIEVATIYLNGNPLVWGINVSATNLEISVYELEKVTIPNAPLEGHILIVTTRGNTYEFDYTRSMGRVYVMEG